MEKITFSSDVGGVKRGDIDVTSKMTEEYFGMEKDSSQISNTKEMRDWIYKNNKNYLNIIKDDRGIIGYSFFLPCTKKLMEEFVNNKITEAELVEQIKKIQFSGVPESIYLCSVIVDKKFQGRGLATSACIKIINKVTDNGKQKPVLFYWEYFDEGGKLARKIAKLAGLELRVRK